MDCVSYFKKISELLTQTKVTDKTRADLSLSQGAELAVQMIMKDQKKIMLIGNGGSAAIASHLHNDLCNSAKIPAMVFTDASQLTALANDYGYEHIYEISIDLWANRGDLLLAISSSGKSENILRAVRAATVKGCKVITFSGFLQDNPLRQMGDLNFYVSSNHYGTVEISHLVIGHYLIDYSMNIHQKLEIHV